MEADPTEKQRKQAQMYVRLADEHHAWPPYTKDPMINWLVDCILAEREGKEKPEYSEVYEREVEALKELENGGETKS